MADIMNVRTRPRVVTEFLIAEGSRPIEIQTRPRSVHGEDAMLAHTPGSSLEER